MTNSKYINPETGMSYYGGPEVYEEFYSIYQYDGELVIKRESQAFPYKENSDAVYIDSFDTYEQAKLAMKQIVGE
jgi:hypothetical protein